MPRAVDCADLEVSVGETTLLAPVTFGADLGELCCVTGANGTGKSTLLRTVAARRAPTKGRCLVFGQVPDEREPGFRRSVASLTDAPPLARDMTVLEQLVLVAASWFGNARGASQRASDLLEELALGGLASRFPHELSSGQLQLVALALVFVRPSRLMLLDEPERHLDEGRVGMLAAGLRRRADEGALVVAATHHPAVVDASDRALNLD